MLGRNLLKVLFNKYVISVTEYIYVTNFGCETSQFNLEPILDFVDKII